MNNEKNYEKFKEGFKEWKRNTACKSCKVSIEYSYDNMFKGKLNTLKDVDSYSVNEIYCENCYEAAFKKLMKSRYVEEYNGQNIYEKDGIFYSNWNSATYCKSLQDMRNWIDVRIYLAEKYNLC